jgi:hypothetical protein
MKNLIKLEGKDVYRIRLIQSGLKYDPSTKLKGQTYSWFKYDGIVFTVNDSEVFIKNFKAGIVHTVFLLSVYEVSVDEYGNESMVRRIILDGHVTNDQMIKMKKVTDQIDSIKKGALLSDGKINMKSFLDNEEYISTLHELIDGYKELYISPSNLKNTSENILINIELIDSGQGVIPCSSSLSRDIRDKRLSFDDLLRLPVWRIGEKYEVRHRTLQSIMKGSFKAEAELTKEELDILEF